MKYKYSLPLVFMVSAISICSGLVTAQEIIRTEYGNVFTISFKDYIENDSKRASCKKLPRVIAYKAFQSQDNQNFTTEEYQRIAGEAPYLGLRGYDFWYDKRAQKQISWDQLFPTYGAFKSGSWDELPVLCGAAEQSKPKVVETSQTKKAATEYGEFNEFILHKTKGLTALSSFYSSGSKWCSHPYVTVIAEYENEAIRKSLLTSNPAIFLQETIIPEIKKICPEFPYAAKYHKQIIDFRFRPEKGRIADERLNPDRLGFKIDDQGNVILVKDISYRNWKDANKDTYSFELEQQDKNDNKVLIKGAETLVTAVNLAINKLDKPLQSALQRREDYKLAFAKTANLKFFEALNLNEDAIAKFQSALDQNKKALTSLKEAISQYSHPVSSISSLENGNKYMDEYKRHREQAKTFESMAWDKALNGDEKFKEGFREVQQLIEQN